MDNVRSADFLNPEDIIKEIGILPGDTVVDFGCGAGYFTLPIAKYVGEEGKVIAIDILQHTLDVINRNAKTMGLRNIVTMQQNLEKDHGSHLDDGNSQWVILANILFMNDEKAQILQEAHRILRKNGKVLVIEWGIDTDAVGPEKDIRIKQEDLTELLVQSHFSHINSIHAGSHHYGVTAQK